MTQKQFSRFMLDLEKWDTELFERNKHTRDFDISAGSNITPEGDGTYVFTSFRLNRSQYSELLDELRRFRYEKMKVDISSAFEIIDDDPLFLMCNLDGVHVQLFFENKDEVLDFQNFLIKNK